MSNRANRLANDDVQSFTAPIGAKAPRIDTDQARRTERGIAPIADQLRERQAASEHRELAEASVRVVCAFDIFLS